MSLEVISVNIWQILISLLNLVILFLILKKFLFKPVKKAVAERQGIIDAKFADADKAREDALAQKEIWDEKIKTADKEAVSIIDKATLNAQHQGEIIVRNAEDKAEGIIRRAETEAKLERKKATSQIKKEIVDVSTSISEKVLEREINENDHRVIIDSFIEKIGDGNESEE